jgi:CHAT domain-containing protein
MIVDGVKGLALSGLVCLLVAGCAGKAPPPSGLPGGERARESALEARRPGEVSTAAVDPLQRLAYRYNTVNWSYPLAIDIDRDLASADPQVAGIFAPIKARIYMAYNQAAVGHIPEAEANLDQAEQTAAASRGALSTVDQRLLRVDLLIGRSILAGKRASLLPPAERSAQFLIAADVAREALEAASGTDAGQVDTGAAAMKDGDAIVLDSGKIAVYNAGQRRNGLGDIVAHPMSEEEKLLVLKVRAEYAQAAALIGAGKTQEAREVNRKATAALAALPPRVVDWLQAEIDLQRATLDESAGDDAGAKAALDHALTTVQKDQGQSRLEAFIWRAIAQQDLAHNDIAHAAKAEATSFKILSEQTDGDPPRRTEVTSYLNLLAHDAEAGGPTDAQLFFEVASVSEETETAQALADVASRFAASDSASGAAIRRLQFAREHVDKAKARLARVRDPEAKASQAIIHDAEVEEIAARQEVADATAAAVAVGGSRAAAVLSPRTKASEVQAVLAPKEGYVRFIFLDDGPGYAILVRKDRVKVVRLAVDETQARAKVAELRTFADTVARTNRLTGFRLDLSHALYKDLFAGLDPDMADLDALVIEPSGPLFSLPFGALLTSAPSKELMDRYVASRGLDYTGAAWLARSKSLELSVGAAGFVRLRKAKPSQAPKPILAFADPQPQSGAGSDGLVRGIVDHRLTRGFILASTRSDKGSDAQQACSPEARAILDFPRLPDTLAEARTAVSVMGGGADDVVAGEQFTDADVVGRKDLAQYRVLLFATHAALPNQAKCWPDPFLITTKGASADSDGVLETTEIANLDLNADLVVLSACNTGASDRSGQALGGLAQSFIFAGSRGVVVSHWVANSKGAASLTSRMYSGLAQGDTPALSLARAERAMMDDPLQSHPYYWALFMVVAGTPVK